MSAVDSNLIEMREVTTAKGNSENLATVETIVTLTDPEADIHTDEVMTGNKNDFQLTSHHFLTCADCGKSISPKIADYSQSKFGKFLCFDCQQSLRKVA